MRIQRETLASTGLIVAFFIGFAGYYIFLIIITQLLGKEYTRYLTVPLRIVILASIAVPFLLYPRSRMKQALAFFILFSFAYLARILFEMGGSATYHRSVNEFLLYFLSFVLIPLCLVSQTRISTRQYDQIFYSVIAGCIILSLLTVFFFHDLIGQVERISQAYGADDDSFISPLALSYVAALGMGAGTAYLVTNAVPVLTRALIYAAIVLCVIPFFLGASRGSVFALGFPLVFYLAFARSVRRRATLLVIIGLLTGLIIVSQAYLGSGILNRVFAIQGDIESGSPEVLIRIDMWGYSWQQFLGSPLFGDSLECDWAGSHPHNMLLEVLITTGILGFIPFAIFLGYVFAKCRRIVLTSPQHSWIAVIFLLSFTQHMVSGGVYSAHWLALGAALIIGYRERVRLEGWKAGCDNGP